MIEFLRDYLTWLRSLPVQVADRIDRWIMDVHAAAWTDEYDAPCIHCRQPWPCELFQKAADRRYARGNP